MRELVKLPGVPALMVLAATSLVGPLVCALGPSGLQPEASQKASVVATALGVTAAVFWVWACEKVLYTADDDWGVVSFALVIVTCAFSLFAVRRVQRSGSSQQGIARLLLARRLLASSAACVCANYIYVFFAAAGTLPSTFQIYLFVGAIYWATAATYAWQALSNYVDTLSDELEMVAELQAEKGLPIG